MKSKDLTLISVLASLYIAIGLAFPMISFGPAQCRISDALYPLIAVLGTPALIGLTLGHFIYNLYGYATGFALGILDVVVSPLLFFIAKIFIWKYGLKAVPIHVAFVGLWVPFLICLVSPDTPWIAYIPIVISVGLGEAIAELILGIPLAKLIERTI